VNHMKQLILIAFACLTCGSARANRDEYVTCGRETLAAIDRSFRLPDGSLYAEEIAVDKPNRRGPAMMWSCGVQLSALAAAARMDLRTYGPELNRFVKALDVYRRQYKGIDGYDVLPAPKPPDRYYDDNEWMALALLDAFEATHDRDYLARAEKAFAFVLSGEDDNLGGGIYWRETDRTTKNACSNGPAATAALRLFRATKKPEYRAIGIRLYEWTNAHLQDADGLFFDHVGIDGKLDRTKFSYNSALMIQANCELLAITANPKYLREARRIALASESRWFHPDTGAVEDDGAFAHLLLNSFLALHDRDHDPHWLDVVRMALACLHVRVRDSRGFYPKRWDTFPTKPLEKVRLLDQASAARAYWSAARYFGQLPVRKRSEER
jgi:uncharacterized protein YyaL (SSP411 family)